MEVPAINKNLSNIYETGELDEKATISIFETVQQEGTRLVKRNFDFYNLDTITAVGYKVNSHQATQFRIWATKTLREFIIKGFVLDDEILKQGKRFGKDYFDELLERIRVMRASERRFYLKITDIYEQCCIACNYAKITQQFFKAHYRIAVSFLLSCYPPLPALNPANLRLSKTGVVNLPQPVFLPDKWQFNGYV